MSLLDPERVYREAEWRPHGLMCARCPHVFHEGEPYTELSDAFVEYAPIVRIVCVGCAFG